MRAILGTPPYLSSPEPGATLSLSRTGSEPAKPRAAQNLRPPAAGDKVCARGTQGFPAPCQWDWFWAANAQNGPVISGHQLVAGEPRASPGSKRDETEASAVGKGGLHLGQTRPLRGPSRCRAPATLARRAGHGSPRGCFRRLLLQPPQEPACSPVHLRRGECRVEGALCRRRSIAPAKESWVSGLTGLDH